MNPEDREKLELDKQLLTSEQFYTEYGYYPDQIDKDGDSGLGEGDWQSPLEWGNN